MRRKHVNACFMPHTVTKFAKYTIQTFFSCKSGYRTKIVFSQLCSAIAQTKYDWVSAIVRDDWENCEKIIRHLKNQKKYLFQGIKGRVKCTGKGGQKVSYCYCEQPLKSNFQFFINYSWRGLTR